MNYNGLYLTLWAEYSAREYNSDLATAYKEYCEEAAENGGLIGIAYTTDETETHEIQVYFDVYTPAYITEIDGDIALIESRKNWFPSDIATEISCISFEDLTSVGMDIISEWEK